MVTILLGDFDSQAPNTIKTLDVCCLLRRAGDSDGASEATEPLESFSRKVGPEDAPQGM